jgi:uncharacterized protein
MNKKFGLLKSDLDAIRIELQNHSTVESAYIFGSRAKGNFKNGSDVDIALKGAGLNFEIINQISYYLNEETNMPYKFDVLDYNSLQKKELKEHIDSVGIKIYNKAITTNEKIVL